MIVEPRTVKLTTRTNIEVRRSLPHAKLKRIGAWVFADHFGPTKQTDGMVVAAHPHTGLQTVTWLFEGEVDHRDSIGSIQRIAPGQLNLMTAGKGIAHSELSIASEGNLHAVQLWLALPESVRKTSPSFEHRNDLPKLNLVGAMVRVLIGEFMGERAKTLVHSNLVALEIRLDPESEFNLPLNENFEHGLLVANGSLKVLETGEEVLQDQLGFLEVGKSKLSLKAGAAGALLVLIGGEPMKEEIVMWWNFIERSHEEIVKMRELWNSRDSHFGSFEDEIGGWIPAPDLPNLVLRPR